LRRVQSGQLLCSVSGLSFLVSNRASLLIVDSNQLETISPRRQNKDSMDCKVTAGVSLV